MKKQFENDDTMEPIGYSVAQGETIWGKTLDSREITIEQYLKRIDPTGIIWKDDGSLPLFDYDEEKIIEHIKKLKTFKKANDYLNNLTIIFKFILKKNNNSIPRCLNFGTLASIIELNTVKNLHSAFRSLKEHDPKESHPLTYWQHVPGVGVKEKQLRNYCIVGRVRRIDNKKERVLLKADTTSQPYRTTGQDLKDFFSYFKPA